MDQAAFGDFYGRTSRSLWSYVYRVTGNAADADDIVQDAFCRLLRGGPDTDEEQRRRYLFRIASNLVVDRWRRQERAADAARRHRGVHGTCVCAARDVDVAGSDAGLVQGAASRALERRAACAASDHRDAADRDRGEPDGSDVALLQIGRAHV